jgi:hypothetical protein
MRSRRAAEIPFAVSLGRWRNRQGNAFHAEYGGGLVLWYLVN